MNNVITMGKLIGLLLLFCLPLLLLSINVHTKTTIVAMGTVCMSVFVCVHVGMCITDFLKV